MKHSFDIDVAKRYGVPEAVFLNNFFFWIEHNRANNVNYHDGRYWTFNSYSAFTELFPYLTEKQIRRVIEHLEKEELVVVGNYNKLPMDRTKWYSLTDKAIEALGEKGKCNCPKGQMEAPTGANATGEKGRPIPDINTDINTDTTTIEDFSPNGHVVVVRDRGCVELDELISFWSNNIHPLVKYEADELICLYQEAGYSNVLEAMKIAVNNHRKNMGYVKQTAYNLADGVDFRENKKHTEPEKPKKTEAELELYRRTEERIKRLKASGQ